MARRINQCELRNSMRPTPRRFVATDAALAGSTDAPRIDATQFRDDLDAALQQDATPRTLVLP